MMENSKEEGISFLEKFKFLGLLWLKRKFLIVIKYVELDDEKFLDDEIVNEDVFNENLENDIIM